jgi:hypothetical protein
VQTKRVEVGWQHLVDIEVAVFHVEDVGKASSPCEARWMLPTKTVQRL